MMVDYTPHAETQAAVSFFSVIYLGWLGRGLLRDRLDLYEWLVLSSFALLILSFVFLPHGTTWLAHALGVSFPFLVMFTALIFVLFVAVHGLIVRLRNQSRRIQTLTQELGLLRLRVEELDGLEADRSRRERRSGLASG